MVLAAVVLGLRVRASGETRRRRRTDVFLAYVLAASLAAGVAQVDLWPFSPYTLAAFRARADARVCQTWFYGVDAGGREWRVDPYAWSPVFDSILQYWFEQSFGRLTRDGRDRVLAFLHRRADQARARLAAGEGIGFERRLGRFHVPYWWLLPRQRSVPAAPFEGFRAYQACWVPIERLAGRAPDRRLLAEGR